MKAIATIIVGLDDLPAEQRTTEMFVRILDELLADLPNVPRGPAMSSQVQVLRGILQLDMDKTRRNRELLKRPH